MRVRAFGGGNRRQATALAAQSAVASVQATTDAAGGSQGGQGSARPHPLSRASRRFARAVKGEEPATLLSRTRGTSLLPMSSQDLDAGGSLPPTPGRDDAPPSPSIAVTLSGNLADSGAIYAGRAHGSRLSDVGGGRPPRPSSAPASAAGSLPPSPRQ
ncbi:hypothetical protein D9Q98_010719 [Chlorella vulgaris]|uniref:Uncharacterized protein n=1 Tax=Chlorella vulgaris TaxID=3077 RepID=A0A9D4YSF6_CHLVU|nr:hypothetical protein D9Q98_010719 [Chlorella vulgaris]